MQKWEYKITIAATLSEKEKDDLDSYLDTQGAEGWELIQVIDYLGAPVQFYFKRPTQ